MTNDELVQQLQEAHALIAKQAAHIAELEVRIAELEQQLDEAHRRGKRQATPFSKGPPKAQPQKPGRKLGHLAAHRPTPERITRMLEAPLPSYCPACGGTLVEDAVHAQYQEDLPRPIETIVTQFNVHVGHCAACATRVQGRHPEQTSDALGSAAVQLGPQVLGLAAELKHDLGLSYGKVARFFRLTFGLDAAPASFARADQRLAQELVPTYAALQTQLQQSAVVHADETGWKIGGHSAWLWVFTNAAVSLYVIDPHRDHAVVERILRQDFAGVLITDCFLAYDPLTYAKSKCVGHLLRRCHTLVESGNASAMRFSEQAARLFRGALTLKTRKATLSAHGYGVACGRLEAAFDRLLARHYRQADTVRFVKLLRKQRPYLFTFLYVETVEPTNNAAERELRPAVIIRKTNGCNRSPAGATAHAVLASVIRTARKHGHDFVALTKRVLQAPGRVVAALCNSEPAPPLVPAPATPPGLPSPTT
ncbi:MAG: IS66 family transposase [Anaerolineae bacterium]